MPEDPTQDPEQALDALEDKVFGTTADQERGEDEGKQNQDDADTTPVTDESPA